MEVVVIMGAVGSPVIRHNSVGEASPWQTAFGTPATNGGYFQTPPWSFQVDSK